MTSGKLSRLRPKLRFPDFRFRPGWPLTTLSTVLEEHGHKSDGASEVHSVSLSKGIVPQVEHLGRSFAASETAHYSLVRRFDVVYTRSPLATFKLGILKQHKSRHNAIVSPLYGVFKPRNPHLGLILEAYFDDPDRNLRLLDPLAQKGAKNTIQLSNDRFLTGAVYLPEHDDEQEKIADCVGSLDDLIAAEGQKLGALRQHKKGLMQQLFPRESEAVPCLRFPEFRDEGEWKESKAGRLFLNRVTKGDEGLPIYSVTMHDGMVRRDSLERNYYDIAEAAGNKKACKDDIAYNMMRMWQGALGVAPEDCLVSPAYVVLVPQEHVVSRFFEYYFKRPASLLLLTSHSRGLTKDRLRLYYDDFARIPIRCPSEPEQQRIADCLSSLDMLISTQARKVDAVEQHKRGLLQQLFPSPEGND